MVLGRQPSPAGGPHLFFGQIGTEQAGQRVAFSPDGRWVTSPFGRRTGPSQLLASGLLGPVTLSSLARP